MTMIQSNKTMSLALFCLLYLGSLLVLTFDALFDYADVMDKGILQSSLVLLVTAGTDMEEES